MFSASAFSAISNIFLNCLRFIIDRIPPISRAFPEQACHSFEAHIQISLIDTNVGQPPIPLTRAREQGLERNMPSNTSQVFTATPSPDDTIPSTPSTETSNSSSSYNLDGISRSASYTQLPVTASSDPQQGCNGIKRTFSENLIANPKANNFRHASIKKSPRTLDGSYKPEDQPNLARKLSIRSKREPKITISKFTLGADDHEVDLEYQPKSSAKKPKTARQIKPKSISSSLTRFARQSWIAPSRSPPPGKKALQEHGTSAAVPSRDASPSPTTDSTSGTNESDDVDGHSISQPEKGNVPPAKSRRPLSSILSMPSMNETPPKVPPIPTSFSTDRLPLSHGHTASEELPGLPKSKSFERLQSKGTESPRRKDDLWGAFRALDGDFQK